METTTDVILPLTEFPKPFCITKWACVSSLFLGLPGIYAFLNSCYLYTIVCSTTSILSINHWRNAEDGIRRKLDTVAARLCFVIYFLSGCYYCRGIYLYGYGITILALNIFTFMLSNYLSTTWHPYWILSHVSFHFSVLISECLVIYCAIENSKETTFFYNFLEKNPFQV